MSPLSSLLALPATVWLLGLISFCNFNLTAGMVLLLASLWFGWLWQAAGSELAFGLAAGCALLAALLLYGVVADPGPAAAVEARTTQKELQ